MHPVILDQRREEDELWEEMIKTRLYLSNQDLFTLCSLKLINCVTIEYAVVTTLVNFMTIFKRVHQENCKQAEFERKKAEKEAEREKMKVSPLKKESEQPLLSAIRSKIG